MLDETIQELRARSLARIAAAETAEALEAVRVDAVGRKGALAEISKGMGKLSPEERGRTPAPAILPSDVADHASLQSVF